jgi:hypothetical protein
MLSGLRAAKEVWAAMSIDIEKDDTFDRLIPLAAYRHTNPKPCLAAL